MKVMDESKSHQNSHLQCWCGGGGGGAPIPKRDPEQGAR